MVAIFCMVSLWASGVFFRRSYTKSIYAVLCNRISLGNLKLPRWMRNCMVINWTLVVLSIGAFVVGVFKVVVNVAYRPLPMRVSLASRPARPRQLKQAITSAPDSQ
ncbi:MAG: hypothetical protein JWP25_2970 [Bradyrhizobium sp.]|nr:hypothetical protein [Bradyrhizobium sp.]